MEEAVAGYTGKYVRMEAKRGGKDLENTFSKAAFQKSERTTLMPFISQLGKKNAKTFSQITVTISPFY